MSILSNKWAVFTAIVVLSSALTATLIKASESKSSKEEDYAYQILPASALEDPNIETIPIYMLEAASEKTSQIEKPEIGSIVININIYNDSDDVGYRRSNERSI